MTLFDRIILSVYTILLAVLSLSVMLIAVKLIPLELVQKVLYTYIYGQWPALLLGGIFFFVSVRLLFAGVTSNRRGDILLLHSESGDVHVRMSAVEGLVEKVARQLKGIRGVKRTMIRMDRDMLLVQLRLIVSPDCHVPAITAEVRQKIQSQLRHTVGVEASDVEVIVEQISQEFKSKQRVE